MLRVKRDLVQMVLAGSSSDDDDDDDEGATLYSDMAADGSETETMTAEADARYRSLIDEWSEAIAQAYGAPPGRPVAQADDRTGSHSIPPASRRTAPGRTAPEPRLRDAASPPGGPQGRRAPEAAARGETPLSVEGGAVAVGSGGAGEATTPPLGVWDDGAMVWEWV